MGVTVLPADDQTGGIVRGGKQAFTDPPTVAWVRPADWLPLPNITPTDNKFVGLVAVTNDDANFLALNATVAIQTAPTFDTTGMPFSSTSTDAATFTTTSVTLTAGYTYLLCVENSHGSDASEVSAITSSTSGLPTFTSRATTQFNSNLNRVTLLTASPTTTWTGTLTINFGGTTQTGAVWAVIRVSGIGNLTDDGIVQFKTAIGSSGTASVTLDNALATGSATFGLQAHASTAASTAGSGYTELTDTTTPTPAQALQTEYRVAGSTTVDATFTSAAWGIIGVELRKATYTVDWGDGTTPDVVNSGTQANHQFTYSNINSNTLTARGYRQAVVTVTPNGYWTTFTLQVKHSQTGLNAYDTGWLDIAVSGPTLTTLTIGASVNTVGLRMVERARILSSAVTTWANQFRNLEAVRVVSVASSGTVTDTQNMFTNCFQLETVPLFTTSSVTNMGNMFNSCYSLKSVPLFNTASVTSMSNMFGQSSQLVEVPAFNTAAVTNIGTMLSGCSSLRFIPAFNLSAVTTGGTTAFTAASIASIAATGMTRALTVGGCSLSKAALETVMTNLGKASGAQTFTIGTNWGAPAVISKASSGTTAGSTTVTISDTSSLATGMEISGTGISDAVAVTFQDTGDTVTRTAHGIPNDTPVSFATITSTTGISTYTTYYVVNATANTLQLSDTVGGSAKALTTDGSGTMLYGTTITSITANTSIELSIPASATGSVTTSSALLKRSIARLKGWTVSG